MKKKVELYRGKTKTVFSTEKSDLLVMKFRDEISSLDGVRVEKILRKGILNNKINYFLMKKVEEAGVQTQIESLLSENEILVKKLDMIPIEFVIRNRSAGSLVNRFGIKEGVIIHPALFELFLKNDSKHDPMINESYCESFGLLNKKELYKIYELSYKINDVLTFFFNKMNFILVDIKLEFGLYKNQIILGDEISLDSIRLWDKTTLNKMDKDRFRQCLGGLIEAYEEVFMRIVKY
ncbi:Phosphoribosylaminoimidazole-succinocarboxamide synthase [Candidatus Providencia siddallii]|uniref:Phosphoribosylaminoimidazole-succinocarboxamide synthase n=1 Tax=Candidatus Providencia siddallii TaxID=1715285 RepID=A0A0M6W7J9_9GAMM|nr:Phosphoribosylaminoimidazole-succinocarboxamide synthase [Candidatus Providencia siddallii]